MADIFGFFQLLLLCLYYHILGIIKHLTPMKLWPKKVLAGETVLITGAGGGVGRQLALQMARRGCKLVLWDLNREGNCRTAELVRAEGCEAYSYTCDVSKAKNVYEVAEKVKADVGTVTILVNNAGIVSGSNMLDLPDEKIIRTIEVNALSHYWTLKSFLPDMIKNNHGHIVTVASVLAESGVARCSDYCASKSAAKATHQAVLREMLVQGSDVKFTAVFPYKISTGLFEGMEIKYPFLLPTMTPEFVADKIALAIEVGQEFLYLPYWVQYLVLISHIVPEKVQLLVEHLIGADTAMESFVGHAGAK